MPSSLCYEQIGQIGLAPLKQPLQHVLDPIIQIELRIIRSSSQTRGHIGGTVNQCCQLI